MDPPIIADMVLSLETLLTHRDVLLKRNVVGTGRKTVVMSILDPGLLVFRRRPALNRVSEELLSSNEQGKEAQNAGGDTVVEMVDEVGQLKYLFRYNET